MKKSKAEWDYAELWDKFPLPAKPCPEELKIEEEEIRNRQKKGRGIELLILGTTNPYRSLAKKLGINPYVADFSKDNYDSLTAYSDEKFENEHFMLTDWLHIDDKNKYDVMLGHRCFNCIRPGLVKEFFIRMYNALKPGGVFFCRGNVLCPEDEDKLERLVDKWAFKKGRELPLFAYLEVELYFRCADKEGYVDYPKARKKVDVWFAEGRISKEDYKLAKMLVSLPAGTLFRGKVTKEEIESAIEAAGFKSAEWMRVSKDFGGSMPIIKLVK